MAKCKVDNCDRLSLAKGYCNTHYLRVRNGKNLTIPIRNTRQEGCKVKGCVNKHEGRGYCKSHLTSLNRETVWLKLIELAGGQCRACGGKFHFSSYDFHHLDPSKKEVAISKAVTDRSFTRVLEEVKKCELLCANCHRQLHYNLHRNGRH